MSRQHQPALTRRAFLALSASVAAYATWPRGQPQAASAGTSEFRLQAAPARVRLLPDPYPETSVWCYGGRVPGPEIRVKQGDRLRIIVTNGLDEDTTVHWHGLRVPNAMDGVPHLTQKPIGRGERFVYEFDARDAGTYWYHPHQRSFEQIGRGLYGPLIIEERAPVRIDRDVTWMLGDWRMTPSGAIRDDFGNRHDEAHDGRIGNTVTINGQVPDTFAVRTGERIRLRLINAANARIFALDFAALQARIIARDGQPVMPHAPDGGTIILGPAMRADVILDLTGKPGSRLTVVDRFYKNREYKLIELVYSDRPLRDETPDWPVALAANPLSEPDLATAQSHEVTFTGGMMGAMVMREMEGGKGAGAMGGTRSMMEMMHSGKIWFINGVAAEGHIMEPMLALARGRSYVLAMTNATAWYHPMHLHGHAFRVISRNGTPTRYREWQDTVLMAPKERVEIAFVADNPGDWMFHCHILEHQASGMMGVIRVAEERIRT
jgi:FtsP/CotA-like multicopper oxidase with cupredoxin domain